jgi:hypothetical protein
MYLDDAHTHTHFFFRNEIIDGYELNRYSLSKVFDIFILIFLGVIIITNYFECTFYTLFVHKIWCSNIFNRSSILYFKLKNKIK